MIAAGVISRTCRSNGLRDTPEEDVPTVGAVVEVGPGVEAGSVALAQAGQILLCISAVLDDFRAVVAQKSGAQDLSQKQAQDGNGTSPV